ncbi:acyl carrier protein [Serratia rhizosphaerae]|uniref:acyl carrier protein n=1 Tax=unclassified Serratia (in: enterobacteria) TaxID=2647522 RepID=UPI000CF6518C|nr:MULTISPECIES: phosphopantetheine-binding protein [unclassified Serratia (in: enterobacteria)]QPT11343.1 acyl carrier protein [Serratia rubidaea]AVJ17713.1 acyl carrier protein [Serratia sp. MYb239]QNK30450.1 acyl carrier protein [Serratia sp. JUb9]CAE1145995.1 Acyl carrier protein [Serratia sp. Tan611]SQJ19869.1 acyl carrier protein [Serratia rubidaea]
MSNTGLNAVIEQRQQVLEKIKAGLIERLNLYQNVQQIDDDTPLFGSGLKLDSVDATEVIVLLDETFNIRVKEGDDPSYMRSVNTLASFVIGKQGEMAAAKAAEEAEKA